MEKARPIEPGCKVMMINSRAFTGMVGTAIERDARYNAKFPEFRIWWKTDIAIPSMDGTKTIYSHPEQYMIRIDDPGIEKEIKQENKKPVDA